MLQRQALYLMLTTAVLSMAQVPTKSDKSAQPKKPSPAAAGKQLPKRIVTNLSGFDLLPKDQAQKQTTVSGATRSSPRPVALAPHLGKIYSKNPLFKWAFPSAKQLRFTLWNDSMDEVFHADVNGYHLRYPDTAPALEDSKTYFWTVEPTDSLISSEASSKVGFVVMSSEQRSKIEPALKSAGSPGKRAQVFTDHRLWYDAIEAYDAAIEANPKSPQLYESRGTVFSQIEATRDLADNDFKRAAELKN